MRPFVKSFAVSTYLLVSSKLFSVIINAGSTSSSLDFALTNVNDGTHTTVVFNTGQVSLSSQVRAVNANPDFTWAARTFTVTGNNALLNGNFISRGFFIGGESSSSTGSVTINNLIFNSCVARGGSAANGGGGGGGMGAGGGLYVGANAVAILNNCSFLNCAAVGGNTGSGAIITPNLGGAGMTGNGSVGAGGFGGDADAAGGGSSGFAIGDAVGTTPGGNFGGATAPAGGSGIGGGSNGLTTGGFGGGGGGTATIGGLGGFGGGGGGGGTTTGNGGFGGGGGSIGTGTGGSGGFGGGGGHSSSGPQGVGGFGGADATNGPPAIGGRGAGFGGAVFLEPGADLTFLNSVSFGNNTAAIGSTGNLNTDPIAGFGLLGQDIFMMSESMLTFNITSNVTMPNPIQGNQGFQTPAGPADTSLGGLTKQGPALLILTGANTYTGTTAVEAGELRILSSVVTDVTVSPGATLSGNFDILIDAMGNGGNLTNNGIVSPGVGGVGLITLLGDYVQGATGTFLVDITPDGQSDRLFLNTGDSTLAGTLEVVIGPGNYIAGTTYEVINGTTNGTEFDTVIQTGPDADRVLLRVDYSSVVITILNSVIFVDQPIDPGTPTAVANCFIQASITPGSDFATITELMGLLNASEVNSALIGLSPARFGALEWINERNNSYVADLLSQHLFELCCSPKDCCIDDCNTSAWINVFGNIMDNRKRLDSLRPFDANAIGVLAGIDYCCGSFYWGGSIGYTHTHLIWRNRGGKGNLDSYYGALYGSWQCDCFSVDVSAIGGATDQHLQRKEVFLTVDRVAKSDPWGYFATGHLGLKSRWNWCCTTFEPYALGDYHYYTRDSFKEKGAGSINLDVRSKTQHMARGEGGLKVYGNLMSDCYCFAPYIGLSWVGEFPLHKSKQKASFTGQDCIMDVTSYDSSVQLASPQGGVKWTCCDGASLTLGYKGLFNKRTRINEVEGRLEWIF